MQALIKFHASHYMKGLHEVVHRDEQTQGFMERSYPIPLCAPIMRRTISCKLFMYSDSYVKSFYSAWERGSLCTLCCEIKKKALQNSLHVHITNTYYPFPKPERPS
jgi:hypothetical protein